MLSAFLEIAGICLQLPGGLSHNSTPDDREGSYADVDGTISHFGTVQNQVFVLPCTMKSSFPALTPFFAARSHHFPFAILFFNENVTVTPLFVAFTPKRPLSSLFTVFTKMTGGGGQAFFSAILSELGVSALSFPSRTHNRLGPSRLSALFSSVCRLLCLSYPSLMPLFAVSQKLCPAFSVTSGLFAQSTGGGLCSQRVHHASGHCGVTK